MEKSKLIDIYIFCIIYICIIYSIFRPLLLDKINYLTLMSCFIQVYVNELFHTQVYCKNQ